MILLLTVGVEAGVDVDRSRELVGLSVVGEPDELLESQRFHAIVGVADLGFGERDGGLVGIETVERRFGGELE